MTQTPQGEPKTTNTQQNAGLIIREMEPENLEFPFSTLDSFITPNERFFIRSHFPRPKLEVHSWRLKIEGAVERAVEINYEELISLPSRKVVAMLECAGNSRVFLVPTASGEQWGLGAVGNAEWTGVSLTTVLESAGLRPDAVEVVLEGADAGEIKEEPKTPSVIHFARSLPLAKALSPDVILAYRMNGAQLPMSHGFPVRAIVPGWYSMASVKWLTRIVVTDRPFNGYFQSLEYSYWDRHNNLPTLTPVHEIEVKAEIARPAMHEVVPANAQYLMHGAAWAGESEVMKVEVSIDGGQTWDAARLLNASIRHAWRLWEYDWHTPLNPGRYTVMARAADASGRVQPMQHNPDSRKYKIDHVLPINVEVK
jgi:DMSO/TMAO reductase YedYZ molybdopterin-dependent catalytic subunit